MEALDYAYLNLIDHSVVAIQATMIEQLRLRLLANQHIHIRLLIRRYQH